MGYGLEDNNSYVKKYIFQVLILSNGIFKVLARFGLILGGLFYFLLYKSSKYIVSIYNLKGKVFYMLVFLSVSVSYDFTLEPFFISTVMFYLFSNKQLKPESKWLNDKARVVFEEI